MKEISPNMQKIISHIGGFDALGKHPSQIDTQKEYNLLGQYLNGSYKIEGVDLEKINRSDKKALKNLFTQLNEKWGDFTNDKVEGNIVTRENLKKYLDRFDELLMAPPNYLSEEELKQAKDKINLALEAYMRELGMPEPFWGDYAFQIKQRLKVLDFIENAEKNSKDVLENIKNPPPKEILEAKVKEYLATNKSISTDNAKNFDTGDGDFNETVYQKSDVCWGLGGINSLAQSKVGLALLENYRYRDEESGIYAIRLKEAENCGLPSGGIYIITPQDIVNAGETIAEGDGDSVAYLLAIDKYFEELNKCKPELAAEMGNSHKYTNDIVDGNLSSRFFEIITGGTTTIISSTSEVSNEIPKGISLGNGISYRQIHKIVGSGNGAAVLSLMDINSDSEIEHAISVVGVKGDNLLIQESMNNSELFLSTYKDFNNKNIFTETEPINGSPTYILSMKNFNDFITNRSVLRWE